MSLTSRMLIKFLQLSGMKGKLAKGSQKTFEEAVSYNRKHPFIMPNDHKAIYEKIAYWLAVLCIAAFQHYDFLFHF